MGFSNSKFKYQYTTLTIGIGLILLIPFGLKSIQSGLEIYPAVIFPAGAEKINLDNDIRSFQSYELYGMADSLIKIDSKKLFSEIPGQYFHSLIKGNFGLESYFNEFQIPLSQTAVAEKNYLNDEKIKEAKKWIKERLLKQNFSDSILVLRKFKKDYNIKSGTLENQNLIYEKTFKLD